MQIFIDTVFKIEQTVAAHDGININGFIPSARVVHDTLLEIVKEKREEYIGQIKNVVRYGGGMIVDVVTISAQGKHFIDFSFQYVCFANKNGF